MGGAGGLSWGGFHADERASEPHLRQSVNRQCASGRLRADDFSDPLG